MLHSSPGPAVELFGGDFMPYSFIAGNVLVLGLLASNPDPNADPDADPDPDPDPDPSQVLGLLAFSKRLSGAVNVALLGLFVNFVGLGLEGTLDHGEHEPTPTPTPTPDPAPDPNPDQARSTTVSTTSRSTTASRAAPPMRR